MPRANDDDDAGLMILAIMIMRISMLLTMMMMMTMHYDDDHNLNKLVIIQGPYHGCNHIIVKRVGEKSLTSRGQ